MGSSFARIAAAIGVLVLSAACVRLGFWQMDRAELSLSVAEAASQRHEMEPLPLRGDTDPAALAPFRRALATGNYEPHSRILLANKTKDGRPGYEVVVPFRIEGTETRVLVNRGWIPLGQTRAPDVSDKRTVRGLLAKPARPGISLGVPESTDRPWLYIDTGAVEDRMGAPILPLILIQDRRLSREALREGMARADKWGMHMGYAGQWFVFAAMGIGLFVFMLRRETA